MSQAHAPYLGPREAPMPVRVLARLSRGLALLEGLGIGLFLGSLVILATWQFAARNLRPLGVPPAPDWINSVLRHSVFFIGFLGAAFATHCVKHLRIDAVSRLFPTRLRLVVRIATTLFACTVCVFLIRAGWTFHIDTVENEAGDLTQAEEVINSARGTMALPIGFGLILFHFVVQILLDAAWFFSGQEPPAAWMAEAHGGEISPDEAEIAEAAAVDRF